jgi:phosphoserine phosphatase
MASGTSSEYLLVQFSGPDQPGITAALMQIVSRHCAAVLDIGQATVHESLALSMLLQAPAGCDPTELRHELHDCAHGYGLTARFKALGREAVDHWLHGLGHRHFIITLLGRAITADQVARVSGIIAGHGMNIERIDRLTGQISPAEVPVNACIELNVVGDETRETAMRAEFLKLAHELSIDIAFQRESIFRRNRRLFCFDMDSTLIQAEVIDELAKMAGVGEQVAKITEAAMRGELNFDESFTRRVGLLKGLPAERVYSLFETVRLADGAEHLIRTLKLLGYKTAILSGGFNFFAKHLQQRLGIDFVHSNELEIVDGVVTGRVIPPIVNGARKAALLEEIAGREGISLEQVVAVGDGANDIPMLNLAGMGIAYRAKPVVREKADQSISALGLDGLLYIIGVRDRELLAHEADGAKDR